MEPENKQALRAVDEQIRTEDPLEVVGALGPYDDTELASNALRDITRVDTILAEDDTLSRREKQELYEMGTNLRLDWLYAEHGGRSLPLSDFAAAAKRAEVFMQQAAAFAHERHDAHPQDFWAIQTKMLDLRAYTAHRFAADSQTTLKDTEDGPKLFGFSQDIMKSVLADSIRLMKDMNQVTRSHGEVAQDARGQLFELLLITYARFNTYDDQQFDTTFVRSALRREDRPINGYVNPKRAFDIVIQTPDSTTLIQAKNHRNDDEYAWPIVKIEDEHFSRTLNNMPKYITDLSLLLDNPKDPLLKVPMIKAQQRLDEAFGQHLTTTTY